MTSWTGDWKKALRERITTLGYRSATELIQHRPGLAMSSIAAELPPFAELQIVQTFLEENLERDSFREASRELLFREIVSNIKSGWNQGFRARERSASILSRWYADVASYGETIGFSKEQLQTVITYLMREAPNGWRPVDSEDPILIQAMRELADA